MGRRWPELIASGKEYWAKLAEVAKINAGADALAWFFRQPVYLKQLLGPNGGLPAIADTNLRQLFLSSVGRLTRRTDCVGTVEVWQEQCAEWVSLDPDLRCRNEALKLLVGLTDDHETLEKMIPWDRTQADFLRGLLEVHEEFPLAPGSAGQVILDALQAIHVEAGFGEEGSDLLDNLIDCTQDDSVVVRDAARAVWGFIAPRSFVGAFLKAARNGMILTEWIMGLKNAIRSIVDGYCGSPMCPSYFEYLESDVDAAEKDYLRELETVTRLSCYRVTIGLLDPLWELVETLAGMLRAKERELPEIPHREAPGQQYLFE